MVGRHVEMVTARIICNIKYFFLLDGVMIHTYTCDRIHSTLLAYHPMHEQWDLGHMYSYLLLCGGDRWRHHLEWLLYTYVDGVVTLSIFLHHTFV